MSAPEVGDRVRVIAGQWTGWEGVVVERMGEFRWVDMKSSPDGHLVGTWGRLIHDEDLEKVPTTPTDGHRGDETGADVETDPDDGSGAQNGGKR